MPHTTIDYTIFPVNPQAHLFKVTCKVANPDPNGQHFSVPAWIPGSYMIRDFAKNIFGLCVTNKGKTIKATMLDKQTWQCEACDGPLLIEYNVYAWDLSVRQAYLDMNRGFFNGTSVFLQVAGQEQTPCRVHIQIPSGQQFEKWRVATTLQRENTELFQAGWYSAANYQELIDHPVELGEFEVFDFSVAGVPHHFVVSGKHHGDIDRVCQDVKRICEHQVEMFGELPAMERYMFLLYCVGDAYGGLEHRSSCSLLCSRDCIPRDHEPEVSDQYLWFLGLCSHEYFHTWNVKQIKPAVFVDPPLDREVYTRLLWAFEGITSYYDDLVLLRSGVINQETYLKLLAKQITRYLHTPGRFVQSIADSSFETWTKFYKQDENALNATMNYYLKGALVACLLDLEIRSRSNHQKSLDDVMRRLWRDYGKPGIGVAENEYNKIIEDETGLDLSDFFQYAIDSCQELQMQALFENFGVKFSTRVAASLADLGGPAISNNKSMSSYLGFALKSGTEQAVFAYLYEDSPFSKAGFSANDVLIAVDGLQVDAKNLEKRLDRYQAGDKIRVHGFRRDELLEAEVELSQAKAMVCNLELAGDTAGWLLPSTEMGDKKAKRNSAESHSNAYSNA